MEKLTEVLDHIITLRFSVHQYVKANLLLEVNHIFNFLLYEAFILLFSEITLSKLGTSLTNLFGLLCEAS